MKTVTIVLFLIISTTGFSQLNDSTLNLLANKIEAAFIKNSKMESGDFSPFSPTNVMFANFEIFENKNDIGFLSFRKLQLSHKFNSDKQIVEWLIPTINKRFMEKYISDNYPFVEKYATLYSKLNNHVCDCITIAKNQKMLTL